MVRESESVNRVEVGTRTRGLIYRSYSPPGARYSNELTSSGPVIDGYSLDPRVVVRSTWAC